MNDGVKILLARMETHPDEFINLITEHHITTKWGEVIADYENYLNPEDREALHHGLKKIHQQRFTEAVMQELLDPYEDNQQELDFRTSGNVTLSTSQILPSSNTTTITIDPLIKKHPTKFGRLYNHEHNND